MSKKKSKGDLGDRLTEAVRRRRGFEEGGKIPPMCKVVRVPAPPGYKNPLREVEELRKELESKQARIQELEIALVNATHRINESTPPPARTGDQIVYKAIEYRKHGEHCRQAMFKHDPNSYSGADEVQVVVVNMEIAKAQALAKLDGVDRLVLGL